MDFFDQVHATILNDARGIYLVNYADRRPTGDAFVIFIDDENANRALTRHRNYLGQRYVELFKASPSEQVQVSAGLIVFLCCNLNMTTEYSVMFLSVSVNLGVSEREQERIHE